MGGGSTHILCFIRCVYMTFSKFSLEFLVFTWLLFIISLHFIVCTLVYVSACLFACVYAHACECIVYWLSRVCFVHVYTDVFVCVYALCLCTLASVYALCMCVCNVYVYTGMLAHVRVYVNGYAYKPTLM